MVSSLDGFIAKSDNDISWMRTTDTYEGGTVLTEEKIAEFLSSIDCYVMGSRTYEHALKLGWLYGDTQVIVLTSRKLERIKDSVQFLSGELTQLINQLRSQYQSIWMVGGAELTRELINARLVDKIVVSILPVLLGGGLPFFQKIDKEIKLHLTDSVTYNDGVIELTYQVKKTHD